MTTFRLFVCASVLAAASARAQRLEILFLGDNGHHEPVKRFPELMQGLGARGLNFSYTDRMADINAANLAQYDALMVYANTDVIAPEQEKALLEYVRGGKGFVPIHCASYCFRNSMQYVALVGGQFKSHGTGTFETTVVDAQHPIMKGFTPFKTWDETYVHTKGAEDRHILQTREGEPYTWTRTEGKGRVFYTAYGHDARTFTNSGFQDLIYRGTLWAVGDERAAAFEKWKPAPFVYSEADVPNYERRNPAPKLQQGLSPEESRKHIQVPVGYELSTIATEPMIYNVIDMKWDERGRLWVVETKDYPNVVSDHASGHDRISVLEDTNGDGAMDKHTVFADKINIPTSLCLVNGGVVVMAAPQTFFLKDTDGNDVADERTVLFSGWGKGDTHAGPSSIRYGFDGWIWGTVGYSGFNGVVAGEQIRFGQGAYRFKPDGSKLEFLGPTSNNTWGMGVNENGDVFGSTANGQSSWYLPIPWTLAKGVDGFEIGDRLAGIDANKKMFVIMDWLRQVDVQGGFTAAAGHEIYTARSYPQDCWNKLALITEPTGHVVYRAKLEQNGTDFSAENAWNLMAGADEWVAPVVALTGPDGAVWVSDWYSFLVQHNPTPNERSAGFNARTGRGNAFVSDLRDTEKCRLYRIAYKGGKPSQQFKLNKGDSAGLLAALKSDNLGWRMHAQRLLIESGNRAVVPELLKIIADQTVDAAGVNGPAINALWTLAGLGAVTEPNVNEAVVEALQHPSSGVRRAAMKVLPRDIATTGQIALNGMLKDKEPLVRLTALLELCSLPGPVPPVETELANMMQDETNRRDKWIPIARTLALVRHGEAYLRDSIAKAPKGAAAAETPAPAAEEKNLFLNAGAEEAEGTMPARWQVRTYSGQAKHALGDAGRTGSRSFFIQSDNGSDTSFHFDVDLERNTDYLLTGWIKTADLKTRGEGKGAMIEIHSLNGRQPFTKPLTGTHDWTKVELKFSTGRQRNVSINLLYGGWGHSTGSAWWDDLSLVKIGASKGGSGGGDSADPLEVVARNLGKFSGAGAVARIKDEATKNPSLVSTTVLKALTAGPVVAAAEESEADLAKTHQIIRIKSTVGTMKYDATEFTATAGKPVAIIYENPDSLQHNIIIGAPGTLEKLGAAADAMATRPQAMEKSFVPDMPEVLAKCKMLDPGQRTVIKFTLEKPGDYPFLCTFPTHWKIMHGVIKAQ
jgi:putative membrane-bound dehydrogenase-like protein